MEVRFFPTPLCLPLADIHRMGDRELASDCNRDAPLTHLNPPFSARHPPTDCNETDSRGARARRGGKRGARGRKGWHVIEVCCRCDTPLGGGRPGSGVVTDSSPPTAASCFGEAVWSGLPDRCEASPRHAVG